jgi:hypothetical protein
MMESRRPTSHPYVRSAPPPARAESLQLAIARASRCGWLWCSMCPQCSSCTRSTRCTCATPRVEHFAWVAVAPPRRDIRISKGPPPISLSDARHSGPPLRGRLWVPVFESERQLRGSEIRTTDDSCGSLSHVRRDNLNDRDASAVNFRESKLCAPSVAIAVVRLLRHPHCPTQTAPRTLQPRAAVRQRHGHHHRRDRLAATKRPPHSPSSPTRASRHRKTASEPATTASLGATVTPSTCAVAVWRDETRMSWPCPARPRTCTTVGCRRRQITTIT